MSAATLGIYFQPRKQQRFHIHRGGFGSGLCCGAGNAPRGVCVLQQRHKHLGGWSRDRNCPGMSPVNQSLSQPAGANTPRNSSDPAPIPAGDGPAGENLTCSGGKTSPQPGETSPGFPGATSSQAGPHRATLQDGGRGKKRKPNSAFFPPVSMIPDTRQQEQRMSQCCAMQLLCGASCASGIATGSGSCLAVLPSEKFLLSGKCGILGVWIPPGQSARPAGAGVSSGGPQVWKTQDQGRKA